ncbi:MAG: signal recognition particle-docking protein FtsY [Bifidobacteriaceae bacterium]|jgi:fused signal recognition particle receptor|nr:signal recognition particle-docking protein FtsY [Bifidobacteriaceae bacterium]
MEMYIAIGAIAVVLAGIVLFFVLRSRRGASIDEPTKLESAQKNSFGKIVTQLFRANITAETWQDIENTLIAADLGTKTSAEIIKRLKVSVSANKVKTAGEARDLLSKELLNALSFGAQNSKYNAKFSLNSAPPNVIMMTGVNGVGKTLTTAKLANYLRTNDPKRTIVLAAADTFRAAAGAQLETLANQVGAKIVRGASENQDPASVAFTAVQSAINENVSVVIIDTAGRLHTKQNLMEELRKVKRVTEKLHTIDEVLLVIDATTGTSGFTQAEKFIEAAGVTGIVLTKLDGSAKGGIVFKIQTELGVPVKFIGIGEGIRDFAEFDAENYVNGLLGVEK